MAKRRTTASSTAPRKELRARVAAAPEMQEQIPLSTDFPTSYSFACSGWLKSYLFGVSKALQELQLNKNAKFIGSSGGSLAAVGLSLDCDFDKMKDLVITDLVPRARSSLRQAFRVRDFLQHAFDTCGNFHNYEKLNESGQCVLVYSSISKWRSRRVSKFDSIDALTKVCFASCCATPIAGLPFQLDGEWVFDGGLFDFQPVLDSSTVTVSPFYCTSADIRPSQYVPMWWALYPPAPESLAWLFELGYEDAYVWAKKQGFTSVVLTKAPAEDVAWATSLGRFLGYRAMENRLLDLMFVTFVVALWKPLAFFLLYTELCTRALISGGRAAALVAAGRLFFTLVCGAGVASLCGALGDWRVLLYMLGAVAGAGGVLCLLALACGGFEGAIIAASTDWAHCRSCMRNVASLSLFLRSVPIIGSAYAVKRHEFLMEHSLVYRLTNHFV